MHSNESTGGDVCVLNTISSYAFYQYYIHIPEQAWYRHTNSVSSKRPQLTFDLMQSSISASLNKIIHEQIILYVSRVYEEQCHCCRSIRAAPVGAELAHPGWLSMQI